MTIKTHNLWKFYLVLLSGFLLSACLDSDSDDDEASGTLAMYVGEWLQACAPSDATAFRSRSLTVKSDGSFLLEGEDFDDAQCTQSAGANGQSSDEGTVSFGAEVSDAGQKGYEVDVKIGSQTFKTIFSEVENGEFFWGDDQGPKTDGRPTTFESGADFAFVKQ